MRLLAATPTTILGPLRDPAEMMGVVIDAERQHLAHRESSQKRMRQPIRIQRLLGPALHGDLHGLHCVGEPAENCVLARRQVGWGRLHARREAASLGAASVA
jgi:hypothetical protein